jgi:hypothetical protein
VRTRPGDRSHGFFRLQQTNATREDGDVHPELIRLELLPRDWFDVAVLVAFAGLSVWLLYFLASRNGPNHLWTGTDGPYIGDQMQYLGWIQDAGHHFLIGNPFNTKRETGDFLNPFLLFSGVLTRFGLSAAASYLVWKPVAILMFFAAAHAYVNRLLGTTAQRRSALVIALFFLSPVVPYIGHVAALPAIDRYFVPVISKEMWPIMYLWGYPLTAIAIASMCLCFLCYERDRGLNRVRPLAPFLGLLCAWLQPWQGATVIGVLVLSEIFMWRRDGIPRLRLLVATCGCTAMPLIYFWALGRFDPVWKAANSLDQFAIPLLTVMVTIAPLAIPALLAYRLPALHFQSVVLRFWPVVTLIEFQLINRTKFGTYGPHALQGLSIPLAVLAVGGVASVTFASIPRMLRTVLAMLLVLLILVPAGVQALNNDRQIGTGLGYASDPYFIMRGEQNALGYLKDDQESGSVLAPVYLGEIVPGTTGRHTWVGIYTWTPNYQHRVDLANALFAGKLNKTQAANFIRSTGARFLLSDCSENANLANLIPVLDVRDTKHFGCATVYRVAN